MRTPQPLPDGAAERLAAMLNEAKSKADYQRIQCVWLRAALGLRAAQIAAALSAAHAVLTRARDARSRLQHVDSLVLAPQVVGDLAAYAPLLIARLHERLGDPTAALAALRRRPFMSEWPRYLGTIRGEVERLER